MKKFVMAALVSVALAGFALADEFTATITKIDGDKITATKKGKKGAKGEEVTLTVDTGKLEVYKGEFKKNDDTGKNELKTVGDAEKGKDALSSKTLLLTDDGKLPANGVTARFTRDGDGDDAKVTKMIIIPGKKKAGG